MDTYRLPDDDERYCVNCGHATRAPEALENVESQHTVGDLLRLLEEDKVSMTVQPPCASSLWYVSVGSGDLCGIGTGSTFELALRAACALLAERDK